MIKTIPLRLFISALISEELRCHKLSHHCRYNGSWLQGLYHGQGSWVGEGGHTYSGQFSYGKVITCQ